MRSDRRSVGRRVPLQLLVVVAVLAFLGGVQAVAATIYTDLWIYQKGDTVQVFGEEFGPFETVDIVTTAPSGSTVDTGTADTDATGAFTYAFVLDSDESGIFDVVATGRDSVLVAATQFDPAHASLSPLSKAFGSVNVGATASQTFTISNTGTTQLNVQAVALSGGNADQFSLNTSGMSNSVAAGTSTTFSVTFAPTSAGAKSASVNVTTNAEDPSAALTGTGVSADTTAPTVSLASAASDPTSTSPIPVSVTFSESVTGFVAGDVTISNGSVTSFAGSGASYTFDLVPAGAGAVTADVAANVATDAAGNGNTAATQLSRTYSPVVNAAPTISDVLDQTIAEDGGTGALAFTVADAETPAGSLTVSGSSSDTTLVPNANITFGGSGASRTVTVVPAANRNGSATITLTVSDGSLTVSDAYLVTVTAVNDEPTFTKGADQAVAEDSGAQTVPGWATAISAGPSDESSQTPTFHVSNDDNGLFASQPAIAADGTLTFTPAGDTTGSATVSVFLADDGGTANGGGDTSPTQTFTITVSSVNDGPSAADDSYSTDEDTTLALDDVAAGAHDSPVDNDTDPEGDTLTVTAVGSPTGGSASLLSGEIDFVPTPDACGTGGFDYTVSDGNGGTDPGHVTVTIACVDDDPVAVGDAPTVGEDDPATTIDVLSNDTDVDGGPIAIASVTQPGDGTVVAAGNDLSLTYEPDADACNDGSPTDDFTYMLSPGGSTATVEVTLDCVNDEPSARDDAMTTSEDTAVSGIDALGNDTDVDGDTLSITAFDATSAQGGTVSCASDCSYSPPSGFDGTDSFTYTVGDGRGGSDTATVTITVTPANQPPTISVLPAAQTVQYSDPIWQIGVLGSDAETPGSGLTILASGMPQGVTFTDNGNGRALLQGVAGDAPGVYPITITVVDPGGAHASVNAVITIVPEDVTVRYTGDHLMFTEPGSHGGEVHLSVTITDPAASDATPLVPILRAATSGDTTSGDVSNATVTFMKGETVLCGPVPVMVSDPAHPTFGTAACDLPVPLPLGSHDIDVHVDGTYAFAARVGQVEIDRATRNYAAGGGFLEVWGSAGDHAADAGSLVSFGFRVRYSPRLTNVRGHANVLFVSGGSTYQVRSRAIDSLAIRPRAGVASFVTYAAFTDVTDPLHPVSLGSSLRLDVQMTDRGASGDRIAMSVYRGRTLVFASRWNGGPVKKTLGGGGIVVR